MKYLSLTIAFAVLLSPLGSFVYGQANRYVVLSENKSAAEHALNALGGKKLKDFQHLGGFAADLAPGQAKKLQDQLGNSAQVLKDGTIQLPETKEVFRPAAKPGGGGGAPGAGQVTPWGITAINARPAWATTRGENCYVCVIDTGLTSGHPDLGTNIRMGTNYINGGSWEDDNGHGTHVAGTVAALDNNIGVVGVAPQANLLAAKAFNRRGYGEFSDIADAILGCRFMRDQWDPLHQKGLVINMSFTNGPFSDFAAAEAIMRPAIQAAYNDGAILVGAAGNFEGATILPPSRYPEVLAAMAMTEDYQFADFSARARQEEHQVHSYIAPGVGVNSTWRNGSYRVLDGTSMAAPHLSGVAALMLSAGSLGIVATDIGLDPVFQGLGLPDALQTVLNLPSISLAGSTTVPEPNSCLLVAIGLLSLNAARRRRQVN
jgi:subtilisin